MMNLIKYAGYWDKNASKYIWRVVSFATTNDAAKIIAIPHCNKDWTPIEYKDRYYDEFNPKKYQIFPFHEMEIIIDSELPKEYQRDLKIDRLLS